MTSETHESTLDSFDQLGLHPDVLKAIKEVGYEIPSPIQAQSIPVTLAGKDIIAQAQTGTGKTAAFALPLLSRLDFDQKHTQILVLAPTRELAIQVAEACESYSQYLKKINVLSIYGGESYTRQISALKRGAQIVVGTPGRVMDHMRKGTLKLDQLKALVLDEADEMLRMGFIDDVEWVLERTPDIHQTCLFSATMPKEIKKIANNYLQDPEHIKVEAKTATAEKINQRFWFVKGLNKLDALSRILEVEDTDASLVFVRTKNAVEDIQQQLRRRGFNVEGLHGDIAQKNREKTVERLKRGEFDVLVATDVVARGLDVERISHVINFDIPYDNEAYIHRIGRTGRAGRSGEAILFVAPRELRLLKSIEKATRKPITEMDLPTIEQVNEKRALRFEQRLLKALEKPEAANYQSFLDELQQKLELDNATLAAGILSIMQKGRPLFLDPAQEKQLRQKNEGKESSNKREKKPIPPAQPEPLEKHPDIVMQRYFLSVGNKQGVKPANIIGCIANEADIDSEYIGAVHICDTFSTVDLPEGMPAELLQHLRKARIAGSTLGIRPYNDDAKGDRGKGDDGNSSRRKPAGKSDSRRSKSPAKHRKGPSNKGASNKSASNKGPAKKAGKPAKKASKDSSANTGDRKPRRRKAD